MPADSLKIIGWDIGGANVKAAALSVLKGARIESRVVMRPFEIWKERGKLPAVLAEVGDALGSRDANAMALTMTAELSDAFSSKREGVLFIFDGIARAFPLTPIYPLGLDGNFARLDDARLRPLDFAATNWVASALYVAGSYPDCILMDVGSTTADIIPIRNGRIAARGFTDMERLASGELVYSGILRTNPNTIVGEVPISGRMCRVAAEYFTVMADVYLILGLISEEAYSCPTPDGRAKTPDAARKRLARIVCADGEMLSGEQIFKLAAYLFEKQTQQLTEALCQVLSGLENGRTMPLAPAGAGAFLAVKAARRLGMTVLNTAGDLDLDAAEALPASAAAFLLAREIGRES